MFSKILSINSLVLNKVPIFFIRARFSGSTVIIRKLQTAHWTSVYFSTKSWLSYSCNSAAAFPAIFGLRETWNSHCGEKTVSIVTLFNLVMRYQDEIKRLKVKFRRFPLLRDLINQQIILCLALMVMNRNEKLAPLGKKLTMKSVLAAVFSWCISIKNKPVPTGQIWLSVTIRVV